MAGFASGFGLRIEVRGPHLQFISTKAWTKIGTTVLHAQRSLLPVSKWRFIVCGGVPICTGQIYSASFCWSSAFISPCLPSSSIFFNCIWGLFFDLNSFFRPFDALSIFWYGPSVVGAKSSASGSWVSQWGYRAASATDSSRRRGGIVKRHTLFEKWRIRLYACFLELGIGDDVDSREVAHRDFESILQPISYMESG